MRAWKLSNFGYTFELSEASQRKLNDYEVRVKIHAASLNFRDLMVARGEYNKKQPLPLIPLSDGAGIVTEVGSKVTLVKVGDKVCATFSQNWPNGAPTNDTYKNTLGSPLDGMLQEEAIFHENGLVIFPKHLDFIEAATLPCAGVTAFHALISCGLNPGDSVLLEGTGGVSLFALQFANILGLKTIITSSSDEKLKRAKSLGCAHGINYKETPYWSKELRKLVPSGVDAVVEVGGAKTLPEALASVKRSGVVLLIGVLSGSLEMLDLRPILMNNICIQGIFVGSKETFLAMNKVISHSLLKPVIDKVFDFKDAPEAFAYLESGQHFGKVCIKMP
jgi:NADPH:quinone reductase-like Zn-dependent oxidoreductase